MKYKSLLALLLFAQFGFAQAPPAAPKPLDQAQLLQLVEAGVDNQRLAANVQERGIDFDLSGKVLATLREKGALPVLLKALGSIGLRTGHLPLDKDLLRELVIAGVNSAELVRAIEARGIDFQPAADFLHELASDGALQPLVNALREASPSPLSKQQVLGLLAGGVSNQRVAELVKERGLAFKPDNQYLDTVTIAGGDATVLSALREAPHPPGFVLLHKIEQGGGRGIHPLAFTPDGRLLALADGDLSVRLWNPAEGKEERTVGSDTDLVRTIAYSPDGRYLAVGGYDETIKVWEVATGRQPRLLRGHRGHVNALAFSPDGRFLASGGQDGTVRLWDVAAETAVRVMTGKNLAVLSVAFSADGKSLAAGQSDHIIRIWDVGTGNRLAELVGHKDAVQDLDFSPDGKYLASSSSDSTIRIWEVSTWRTVTALTGHRLSVWCVAFTRDGHYLVSGGADGSLRLWELSSGHEIARLLAPGLGTVPTLAFSADGKYLAAARDDTVFVWQVKD